MTIRDDTGSGDANSIIEANAGFRDVSNLIT